MGVMAQKALDYAIAKIGCRYSQDRRWEDDIFDCSSLVYRAYKAAGYLFKSGSTSTTEVYDTEFDRLWPAQTAKLGQTFTSVADFKKQGYKPRPGDLIYLCTNSATTRANKITHVVMVENATTIVHARGTAYGVRRDNIDLYGAKVVAVTRYRDADYQADNTGNFLRAATAVCNTSVNIRETPNGKILGTVPNDHPLVVSGNTDWLNVSTLIDGKPIGGVVFASYVSA